MPQSIIQIEHISKCFHKKTVLNDITLSINKGDSIAFLGNNGSGKSTLLKIISGLMTVSSGEIKYSKELKFQYIPEHFPKMNLTAKEYILHMGHIEGLTDRDLEEKMNHLFQAFFMENMINIPMKHLSKGTLQKVGVIQALLDKPDVILLDEPLSGQDIKSQKQFISSMKEWNKAGITILMSCHELFLVNQLSNQIYELKNGALEEKSEGVIAKEEYDTLIFLRTCDDHLLPKSVMDFVLKVDYDKETVILLVPPNISNDVIITMLQNNFRLRAMNHV
jgi:ABC-type multidrug transport system ATPase subunit